MDMPRDHGGSSLSHPHHVSANYSPKYRDVSNVYRSYLRSVDGVFTIFDVPGAGTVSGQGTVAANINARGDVPGWYVDANGVNHGFLRSKDGTITTFDVPGARTGSGQGTIPIFNNPADAITGSSVDANTIYHGFLRIP
jgi:hypothetical protein